MRAKRRAIRSGALLLGGSLGVIFVLVWLQRLGGAYFPTGQRLGTVPPESWESNGDQVRDRFYPERGLGWDNNIKLVVWGPGIRWRVRCDTESGGCQPANELKLPAYLMSRYRDDPSVALNIGDFPFNWLSLSRGTDKAGNRTFSYEIMGKTTTFRDPDRSEDFIGVATSHRGDSTIVALLGRDYGPIIAGRRILFWQSPRNSIWLYCVSSDGKRVRRLGAIPVPKASSVNHNSNNFRGVGMARNDDTLQKYVDLTTSPLHVSWSPDDSHVGMIVGDTVWAIPVPRP